MPRRIVEVRHIQGKQRLGVARSHTVLTDRTAEEGGNDSGFLSGELLLIALGSCVLGSLKHALQELDVDCEGLAVIAEQLYDVHADEPAPIAVELLYPRPSEAERANYLLRRALAGGVGRRLSRASEIRLKFCDDVRFVTAVREPNLAD